MRHVHLLRSLAIAAAVITVSACSSDDEDVFLEDDTRPASVLLAEADAALADGDAELAAVRYEEVERLHPWSSEAKVAMIEASQAYYLSENYEQAALAAQRFLAFYPTDPEAPRAQYLIGVSYYDQIADVGRDQANTRRALQELRTVEDRYPDTSYARDARLKIDLALDHLAGKEMEVGRFYLKRGQHVAAINRFRTVIERYQTTTHAPEALHRLVESYLALGVVNEAQTAAAVLGYNFPGSPWYADSYALLTGVDLAPQEDDDSWISRSYRQIVQGEWL